MRRLGRGLWLIFGFSAVAIGAIGIVLPILPTTPFVILAAFAFGKSSKRFQRMFEQNRVFEAMIADWRAHGAIANEYKALAILMMGAALAVSVALSVSATVLIVQVVCITAAAAFIFTRPSRAKN
ncbi:MAG: YbaN family protein [Pseudomonadota bacterium]